jgi:hypothetical protein
MTQIANLWTTYLGTPIAAEQVAMCQVLLKISRSCSGNYNVDDYIDILGYGAIASECSQDIQTSLFNEPAKPSPTTIKVGGLEMSSDTFNGFVTGVMPEESPATEIIVFCEKCAKFTEMPKGHFYGYTYSVCKNCNATINLKKDSRHPKHNQYREAMKEIEAVDTIIS